MTKNGFKIIDFTKEVYMEDINPEKEMVSWYIQLHPCGVWYRFKIILNSGIEIKSILINIKKAELYGKIKDIIKDTLKDHLTPNAVFTDNCSLGDNSEILNFLKKNKIMYYNSWRHKFAGSIIQKTKNNHKNIQH